ncbi:MAG: hypothetical protein K8S20_00125 [Chloroflexi bacterium]|jgi:hypothetical protein|nr:hypothetical protein [Chloroflexota bacterium]
MFQEATPDTSGYMIAGYAITFIVMGIYVLSLYLRNSNLKRDAETLESLQVKDKPKAKPAKAKKK